MSATTERERYTEEELLEFEDVKYWRTRLSASTWRNYMRYFKSFMTYVDKDPEALLAERHEDLRSDSRKIKRRHERLVEMWAAERFPRNSAQKGQAMFCVASFYKHAEARLEGLRLDKVSARYVYDDIDQEQAGDIINVGARNLRDKAWMSCQKDSALGTGDLLPLTFGRRCAIISPKRRALTLLEALDDPTVEFLMLPDVIRKKTKVRHDTWFGPDALKLLRVYMRQRRRGTRRVKPEKLTGGSPLFVGVQKSDLSHTMAREITTFASERVDVKYRNHQWRTFFGRAMSRAEVNQKYVDYWQGHTMPFGGAYFDKSPEMQLEQYRKAYPYLSIQHEWMRQRVEVRAKKTMDRMEELFQKLEAVKMGSDDVIRVRDVATLLRGITEEPEPQEPAPP